jgi:hypothetical protein
MKTHALICMMLASFLFVLPLEGKSIKGAEYRTKQSFLYGRFEARIKANGRSGMLTSFFTYNDSYPSTPWNEIDIEIMGRYTNDVQFNTITPGQAHHVSHRYVPFNTAREFHVYGFEWTPDYVAWFIDSVEVYRQTGEHIATLNQPQKLMMNVWPPAHPDWAGEWNAAVLPAFAYYDWVRYASYTPGGGNTGTGNNFTTEWRDDFDAWDQTRWDKATHTWGGNNCDFVHENAVFRDGNLVLCLTSETALGYQDGVAPTPLWARIETDAVRIHFSEEVTETSATTFSNFLIPSNTITSAQLLSDGRTVLLGVPGVLSTSVSSIAISGITDRSTTPNTSTLKAVVPFKAAPLAFPVYIDLGGAGGGSFLPDQPWGAGVEYGYSEGSAGSFPGVAITGTTYQDVYRTELAGFTEYTVRVPNGIYMVTLMMAENYFSATGKRVSTIVVEGNAAVTAFDLYANSGWRTAYQRSVLANVSDGMINIHAQGLIDRPLLNGMMVSYIGTGVDEGLGEAPSEESMRILGNYPNPFNGTTQVALRVPAGEQAMFRVYDLLGRMVSEQGVEGTGTSLLRWDPASDASRRLASGIYVGVLEGSNRSRGHRLMYLQ